MNGNKPPKANAKRATKRAQKAAGEAPFVNDIHIGDSVEVMGGLPALSVDMVFADPPYTLQPKSELRRPNNSFVDGVTAN